MTQEPEIFSIIKSFILYPESRFDCMWLTSDRVDDTIALTNDMLTPVLSPRIWKELNILDPGDHTAIHLTLTQSYLSLT